ncbi:c-type cytochrome [Marinomonas sp. M1K-6]|uniref:C-type cytochrome n=1 Tax=Marinomonas profundi TaxID=2726122 RepID=A0A847RCY2_9GAMM|nr:di-heme oxidoredictase family protein [Marinomonas profundi]NLQ18894.1 c-type cytochrome [Marinomonas profundi]UDV02829.1 c-type cytochrome [Marinomonas profundi]
MTVNVKKNRFIIASAFAGFFCFQHLAMANDYSTPLVGIDTKDKLDFYIGEGIFQKFWVPSPSSTTASDGLGPLFNARSCNSCHVNNGRGHAPEANIKGASVPSFMVRLGKQDKNAHRASHFIYPNIGDKIYGHQFQGQSSPGILPEGDYRLSYSTHLETLADGTEVKLRKPNLHWTKLNYGDFDDDTGFTMLVSPALVGMGLLDNITNTSIMANADPDDRNNDGISGRVNWIYQDKQKVIGRFGYKASVANIRAQNQSAFNTDLGLSTPLNPAPSGDCSLLQRDCLASPNGNSAHLDHLEVDQQQARLVDLFVLLSSPPAMRNLTHNHFLAGKRFFDEGGCARCHTPKMQTGNDSNFTVLNNRTFYPFTDMLLHDMGPELASGFPSASASPREWRTAPLWGIGLSEKVSGRVGFLHDGRARTIEEAILWHGGEAKPSQAYYKKLNKQQRNKLIYFLESL